MKMKKGIRTTKMKTKESKKMKKEEEKRETMKKMTKPASTTIAVFVTCSEILWRDPRLTTEQQKGNLSQCNRKD